MPVRARFALTVAVDSSEQLPTMRPFVNPPSILQSAAAVLIGCFVASCAEFDQPPVGQSEKLKTAMAAPAPEPAYWDGAEGKGSPKIVVNLSEQRAYFYKGKRVVGESNISTGRKGFETPPGKYRVIQKDEDHVSNLYGNYVDVDGNVVQANVEVGKDPKPEGTEFVGAPMPNFLRFTRGYGMHAGFVPRYRASHGCIRMPHDMSKHFFDAATDGMPVIVEE